MGLSRSEVEILIKLRNEAQAGIDKLGDGMRLVASEASKDAKSTQALEQATASLGKAAGGAAVTFDDLFARIKSMREDLARLSDRFLPGDLGKEKLREFQRAVEQAYDAAAGKTVIGRFDVMTATLRKLNQDGIRPSSEFLEQYRRNAVAATDALHRMGLADQATRAKQLSSGLLEAAGASEKAAASAQKTAGAVSSLNATIGKYVAAGAIVAAIRHTAEYADTLDETAQGLQISTDALQRLSFAASQNGSSMAGVTTTLQNLSDKLGSGDASAARAVQKLGLSFEQLKAMAPDQAFLAVAKALRSVEDANTRNALAADLLGKSWKQMMPTVLSDIDAVMAKAPIMSRETVAALGSLNDSWDALATSGKVLLAEVMGPMVPTWQSLVNVLVSVPKPMKDAAVGALELGAGFVAVSKMAAAIAAMGQAAGIAGPQVDRLRAALTGVFRVYAAWEIGQGLGQLTDQAIEASRETGMLAWVLQQMPWVNVGKAIQDTTENLSLAAHGTVSLTDQTVTLVKASEVAGRTITSYSEAARILSGNQHTLAEETRRANDEINRQLGRQTTQRTADLMLANPFSRMDEIRDALKKASDETTSWKAQVAELSSGGVLGELQRQLRLGVRSTKDLADIFKISEGAVKYYDKQLKEVTESQKKAADAAKKHADEERRLFDELTGFAGLSASTKMVAALGGLSGLYQASGEGLEKIKKAALEAADGFRRLGDQEGYAAQMALANAAAGEQMTRASFATSFQPLGFGQRFHDTFLPSGFARGSGYTDLSYGDGLGGTTPPSFRPFAGMGNLLTALPAQILGAIQGGGNIARTMGASVFGSVASTAGRNITGAIGGGLGKILGSSIPIVGTLLGGTVGKWIGGLFGGESEGKRLGREADQQTAQRQAALVAQFGSREAIAGMGPAGADLAASWWDKNVAGAEHFKTLMDRFLAQQETLNQAMQEYGISWEEMGPKVQASKIGEIGSKLTSEYDALTQAGASTQTALSKMAPAFNDLVSAAARTGQKIPADLVPIIKKMAELHLLTEDTQKALLGLSTGASVDFEAMQQQAQGFGIDLSALGPAFQQAKINATAKDITDTFKTLTDNGGIASGVLTGMSDEISQLVIDARKFGTSIPDNMKPLIQQLIDSGQLLDENGNKITDLGSIKFADPIKAGFQDVVDAIDRLGEKLSKDLPENAREGAQGVNDAFAAVHPEIGVRYKYYSADDDTGASGAPVPQHAEGAFIRRDHTARVHAGELIGPIDFMANALQGALKALGVQAGAGGFTIQPAPVILDGRQIGQVLFDVLPFALQARGVRV